MRARLTTCTRTVTCLIILSAPFAGRWSDRVGSRYLVTSGMAIVGTSLVLFAQVKSSASYYDLLPALLVAGLGIGLSMSPMTAAALQAVPPEKAGVGSGLLNTFRQASSRWQTSDARNAEVYACVLQIGGSMGIAILGAVLTQEQNAALSRGENGAGAFMSGLHRCFYVAAGISYGGALFAFLLMRNPNKRAEKTTSALQMVEVQPARSAHAVHGSGHGTPEVTTAEITPRSNMDAPAAAAPPQPVVS